MLLPPAGLALDPAWFDAIATRTSKRTYDGRPLAADARAALESFAEGFRPFAGVRIQLVGDPGEGLFTGYAGSYGRIKGAPAAAAFIGPEGEEVAVGYIGEAFVLEATRQGVATCWVAGSYDRGRAAAITRLDEGERILSLTPLGYAAAREPVDERLMRRIVRAAKRKPLDVLAPGAGSGSWPQWAVEAAEAARWAPTGGNGQPQRLRLEDGGLVVGRAPQSYWTAPLDLGIVMLHVELGALHADVRGVWRPATAPDVARFEPRT